MSSVTWQGGSTFLNHKGEPICCLLPFEARMKLVAASRASHHPVAKAAAIEEAVAWCKAFYPSFFQPLKENHETQTR